MAKTPKLSILQQALFEEKKLKFSKRTKNIGRLSYSEQMKLVLPNINLMYKQEKFVNAKSYINWMLGGFQSGKTEVNAAKFIWLADVNAPYPGLIISPTATNCEVVMLRKLQKLFLENDIAYKVKHHSGLIEVTIFFGPDKTGTVFLGSGESTAPWIGMTVAFAGMDEPFRQSEETFLDMISRVSEPKAVLPMINNSGTPEPDTQTWGDEIIETGEDYSEERSITIISTRDNIYLRPGYVKSLEENLDSSQQQNYISGIATSKKGGKMYYMYDDKLNVIPDKDFQFNVSGFPTVLVVYDFNNTPMCAADFIIKTPELIQTEEYSLKKSNTWDMTELIIHRLKERYSVPGERRPLQNVNLIITGDRTAMKADTRNTDPTFNDFKIIASLFSKAGISYHMEIPDQNPPVYERVVWMNNILEKRYFKILSHCKESREDLRYVKQKSGVIGFHKDKSNPKRTHFSDILDYAGWLARRMGIFPFESAAAAGGDEYSYGGARVHR